ncbi:hypothetical protein D3C85_1692390 [compost metagenome]
MIHLDLYEWIMPKKVFNNGNIEYENLVQDLNLHYVGITRARKGCLLISSTFRTNYNMEQKAGKNSEFIWRNEIEKLRYKKK